MPDETLLSEMNLARRTNRMAERSVRDWLYADYLFPEIEKKTVFTAELFDVVRGGIRVCLQENGAFIFVPMSLFSAQRDDLEFDNSKGRIFYKGDVVYSLGDTMKVRIVDINKETRSIVGAPVELPLDLPLVNVEEMLDKRAKNQRRPNNNR